MSVIKTRRMLQAGAKHRRGMLSVEMIFLIPLLMVFVLAIVQFGMMFHARQQLSGACREGGRTAAVGGDADAVRESIVRYLGGGRLCAATYRITDKDGHIVDDPNQIPSGEPIEVWVEIPTAHAVPDMLGWTGFSIKNDVIICRTVMRKE